MITVTQQEILQQHLPWCCQHIVVELKRENMPGRIPAPRELYWVFASEIKTKGPAINQIWRLHVQLLIQFLILSDQTLWGHLYIILSLYGLRACLQQAFSGCWSGVNDSEILNWFWYDCTQVTINGHGRWKKISKTRGAPASSNLDTSLSLYQREMQDGVLLPMVMNLKSISLKSCPPQGWKAFRYAAHVPGIQATFHHLLSKYMLQLSLFTVQLMRSWVSLVMFHCVAKLLLLRNVPRLWAMYQRTNYFFFLQSFLHLFWLLHWSSEKTDWLHSWFWSRMFPSSHPVDRGYRTENSKTSPTNFSHPFIPAKELTR